MDEPLFAAAGLFLILMTACSFCPFTAGVGELTPTPTPSTTPTPETTSIYTPTPEISATPSITPTPSYTATPHSTSTPQPTPTQTHVKEYIPNGDFETGTYEHWSVEENGFGTKPSDMDAANREGLYLDTPYRNYHGRYAASSYLPTRDAGARGVLMSEVFTISKPYLEFLVNGMQNAQIYIELQVEGRAVKHLEPDNPTTHFQRITWNVSKWQGKTARIKIVDESATKPRGYIEVDDFYLTDTPTINPT